MQDNTNQGIAQPPVPQQPVSSPVAAIPAPLSSHPQGEMINPGEEIKDPPKKSRKLLFVVLALVLLVALVVGGLFVYRTLFGAKVLDENMIIAQTPTPEAMVEDEMSDWETYTSESMGISFQYPLAKPGLVQLHVFEYENPLRVALGIPESDIGSFIIYKHINKSVNEIYSEDKNEVKKIFDSEMTELTIDELNGLDVQISTYRNTHYRYTAKNIYIQKGSDVYKINLNEESSYDNKILSTFEFVD